MKNKRKSFLLHIDSLAILNDLTSEQAGDLFKAIYSYQIDADLELDQITKMVFLPFKNQFNRDNEKYIKTCEKRAIAGSKGGKQKVANASNCKQTIANVADNKNKNKNKNNSDNERIDICQQIADAWNDKFPELSQVLKLTKKRKSAINGCIKEMKTTKHDFTKIETWIKLFDYASGSDFLMGKNGNNWTMTFDFVITKSKLIKIIEGDYDNA